MTHYRLYFLDEASRIAGHHELDCNDDQDACRESVRLSSGQSWELWRGTARLECAAPDIKRNSFPAARR